MGKTKSCPNCSASSNTEDDSAFEPNSSPNCNLMDISLNEASAPKSNLSSNLSSNLAHNPNNFQSNCTNSAGPASVASLGNSASLGSFNTNSNPSKNCNSPSTHAPKLDINLPKKRKPRLGRILPPPDHSACLYVEINPKDIAMFKFLLEAEDNLGYMSVVDRWSAALKVVYSPHQQKAMQMWLADTAKALQFKEIWLNKN